MAVRPEELPEREKQVLRLLLTGHDAKSIGTVLGLSTNVVNERLRDSRQKLAVGSSKQAARMLAAVEPNSHNFLGNNPIGIAATASVSEQPPDPGPTIPERQQSAISRKGLIMTTISALFIAGAAIYYAVSSTPAGPPEIVATYPADGSTVPAGPYTLKITYDRPMAADSYSFVQVSRASYPVCDGKPKQSIDGRSFTMACIAKPAGRYVIWLNRAPYMNFKSKDGLVSAKPKRLLFRTK